MNSGWLTVGAQCNSVDYMCGREKRGLKCGLELNCLWGGVAGCEYLQALKVLMLRETEQLWALES